ncbi:hypothetical protein [Halobacterium sp. CBA1126]|uniref:hypothetical protein n=1 Tax=Halobacterium sp. CBA1126 TaxID=2668074 RepID=UPI0012F84D13|nr:hypothetical protein [Halobacterium sp. CBA1126]
MTTTDQTGHKSSPTDSGESTTNNDESAPYVCNHDDCFAAFGSTEARDEHEASDHNEGGA